ncbi:MAG: hypothetical protein AAGA80_05635 [Cyanobacteria bacterium P01_F01_bin.143]
MALKDYPNHEQCTIKTKDPKISLKENKSQFILINDCQKDIYKTQVDGCLNIKERKCDYLLTVEDNELYIEIYVELKGNKVDYAIKQLEATIKNLAQNNYIKKYCYVVSTKGTGTPGMKKIEDIKRRFDKQYNATLKIKSKKCEQLLSKLI